MRELITQITGMVIGSSIVSFFGLRGIEPKAPITVVKSKAKADKMRTVMVAIFFLLIIGLALFEIIALK